MATLTAASNWSDCWKILSSILLSISRTSSVTLSFNSLSGSSFFKNARITSEQVLSISLSLISLWIALSKSLFSISFNTSHIWELIIPASSNIPSHLNSSDNLSLKIPLLNSIPGKYFSGLTTNSGEAKGRLGRSK